MRAQPHRRVALPSSLLAWDAAGELLLSPVPKELSQPFSSSSHTRPFRGQSRRTRTAQLAAARAPLPAHTHPALAARSTPERRRCRVQLRGGAGGGGGEEAPRAEQSRGCRRQRGAGSGAAGCCSGGPRGWRGWQWCSWVRGAAAGGAGLRGSESGRDRARLCPSGFFPTSCTFHLSPGVNGFSEFAVSFLLGSVCEQSPGAAGPVGRDQRGHRHQHHLLTPRYTVHRLHLLVPSVPGPRPHIPRVHSRRLQGAAELGGAGVGVGRPPLQLSVARPARVRGRGSVLLRPGPTGGEAGAAAGHEPLWAGRRCSAVLARRGRCRSFLLGTPVLTLLTWKAPRAARHSPE